MESLLISLVQSMLIWSLQEFEDIAPRARWIYTDGDPAVQSDTAGTNAHGSGMLAHLAGKRLGKAKKINPVIVKVGWTKPAYVWLEGLSNVLQDVLAKGGAKTVLNLSLHWSQELLAPQWTLKDQITTNPRMVGWIDRMYALLTRLEEEGVLIVTASGNDAEVGALCICLYGR